MLSNNKINALGDLINFIKTTKLNCAYKLIVLFSAIKLRDRFGKFEKEKLIDFFIDFYNLREKNKLKLDLNCNPLQNKEINKVSFLLERNPIRILIENGILASYTQFTPYLLDIIFQNEILLLEETKNQIKKYYTQNLFDNREIIDNILNEWEKRINHEIKETASKVLSSAFEKIEPEYLLKYLYQSYSQKALDRLIKEFKLSDQDFQTYFNGESITYLKKGSEKKIGSQISDDDLIGHRRKELVEKIKLYKIAPSFMTFLIDKWNKIGINNPISSTSTDYIRKFYNYFNIEIKIEKGFEKFFNFITGRYVRDRTIHYEHQPRRFGCYYGIENRTGCKNDYCDQVIDSKAEGHRCNRSKGNIWVQDGLNAPIRLSKNYIPLIKEEILKNQNLDLNLFAKFLYNDKASSEKFIEDFNLNDAELNTFFKYNKIKAEKEEITIKSSESTLTSSQSKCPKDDIFAKKLAEILEEEKKISTSPSSKGKKY